MAYDAVILHLCSLSRLPPKLARQDDVAGRSSAEQGPLRLERWRTVGFAAAERRTTARAMLQLYPAEDMVAEPK